MYRDRLIHDIARTCHAPSPRVRHAPPWFRYGVIALAVLVLCSCRRSGPDYRVADEPRRHVGDRRRIEAPASRLHRKRPPQPVVRQQPPFTRRPTTDCGHAPRRPDQHCCPGRQPRPTAAPIGRLPCDCGPARCCLLQRRPVRGPNDEYLCDGGDFGSPAAVVDRAATSSASSRKTPSPTTTRSTAARSSRPATRSASTPRGSPPSAQVVDLRALRPHRRRPTAPSANSARSRIDETRTAPPPRSPTSNPTSTASKRRPACSASAQQPGELDRDRRVAVTLGTLAAVRQPANRSAPARSSATDIVKIARASLAAITWAGDQAAQVVLDSRQAHAEVGVANARHDLPAGRAEQPQAAAHQAAPRPSYAQPGDEVEFTLRFDNVGDRVIGNVTILDSLTTRLEYIEGSQKCSLEADFETTRQRGRLAQAPLGNQRAAQARRRRRHPIPLPRAVTACATSPRTSTLLAARRSGRHAPSVAASGRDAPSVNSLFREPPRLKTSLKSWPVRRSPWPPHSSVFPFHASLARPTHGPVRQLRHPQGLRPRGQDEGPDQPLDRPARLRRARRRSSTPPSRRSTPTRTATARRRASRRCCEQLQAQSTPHVRATTTAACSSPAAPAAGWSSRCSRWSTPATR